MALTWVLIPIFILILLVIGYLLPSIEEQKSARLIGWLLVISTAGFSTWVSSDQAPLIRMLIIVVLQLVSMKILVMVETYSEITDLP